MIFLMARGELEITKMRLRTYLLLVTAAKALEGPLYLVVGFFGALGLERLIKWAWKAI